MEFIHSSKLNSQLDVLNTLSTVYQRLSSVSQQVGIDQADHEVFDNILDLIAIKVKEIKG